MKDFRRTPKHMTRVPAPRPAMENVPTTSDSGDEEDEVSFNRHVKVLQQECRKGRPNQHVLTELMSATFKHRYKEIQDHPLPVSTILQKYPALKSFDEVRHLLMHETIITCMTVAVYSSRCSENSAGFSNALKFARMPGKNGIRGLLG